MVLVVLGKFGSSWLFGRGLHGNLPASAALVASGLP